MKRIIKSIIAGTLGSLALTGFYFLVTVFASGDWQHPWQQFWVNRYWMGLIIIGFGIQVGLFWHLKQIHKEGMQANMTVGSGAGLSGGAIIACCSHHLADIVPSLGLSAASTFLIRYQTWFLALGVVANAVGIALMLKRIREAKC